MSTRIRRAHVADLPAVGALDREVSPVWEGIEAYRVYLEPGGLLLVAELDGTVCGFVALRRVLEEAEIINVAVAEPARRRGAARLLLQEAVAILADDGVHRLLLDVRESNAAARSLYRRCGFDEDGRRRDYYPPPAGLAGAREAAILMSRDLREDNGNSP